MNTTLRSAEYQRWVGSPKWQALKQKLIAARGHLCQRCRRADRSLDLHHRTYDRLGRELPEDLELLCRPCHVVADQERAAQAQYEARLNGWATKRYGEEWWESEDYDLVCIEFDMWLERRGDQW